LFNVVAILFSGFVLLRNRSKNHLKRKLLPVKKIQHKPPVQHFQTKCVDRGIDDGGYNPLLSRVATGAAPLHTTCG
jgi:hypothetical protein